MTNKTDKAIEACKTHWEEHKADCSGFVKAVANELGVTLTGNADNIVKEIQTGSWVVLADGKKAKQNAEQGHLVVGGLRGEDHTPARSNGHVVIVVKGPLAHGKYPSAYWGSLGSTGKKNETVNWSWNKTDRDKVIYASKII